MNRQNTDRTLRLAPVLDNQAKIEVDRINREGTMVHRALALPLRDWKRSRIAFRCNHGDAA